MKKIIYLILCISFALTGCFGDSVEGEIVALSTNYIVGEPIPFVLEVPEKYDDLHMEMWSCTLDQHNDSVTKFEYIEEEHDLEAHYSKASLEAIFSKSSIDIYREDLAMETVYSPRIMLFTPMEAGTYTIAVSGYYHSTSPSEITSLEVIIHEK